jgi:hypothetical protein
MKKGFMEKRHAQSFTKRRTASSSTRATRTIREVAPGTTQTLLGVYYPSNVRRNSPAAKNLYKVLPPLHVAKRVAEAGMKPGCRADALLKTAEGGTRSR